MSSKGGSYYTPSPSSTNTSTTEWTSAVAELSAKIFWVNLFTVNTTKENYYQCIYCNATDIGLKLGSKGYSNFKTHILNGHNTSLVLIYYSCS